MQPCNTTNVSLKTTVAFVARAQHIHMLSALANASVDAQAAGDTSLEPHNKAWCGAVCKGTHTVVNAKAQCTHARMHVALNAMDVDLLARAAHLHCKPCRLWALCLETVS